MNRIRSFVLLLVCCAMAVSVLAQEGEVTEKPAKKFKFKKTLKLADRKIKAGNIYGAAESYEEIMERKPEAVNVAYKLAVSYQAARDYKNAAKWYKHVIDQDADAQPMARYWYATMLKMTGQYMEAKVEYDAFIKTYKGESASTFKRWAKEDVEGCDLAIQAIEHTEEVNLTHLGAEVNHAYTDLAPVVWDDTTLVYATLPIDTVPIAEQKDELKSFITLYSAVFKDDTYTQSMPFERFKFSGKHVANGAFSPDGKRFYFTVCAEEVVGNIICAIYVSTKSGDGWSEPEDLGPTINSTDYTTTHPAIGTYTDDREVLYFVSNRPGGRGGLDIWYSIYSPSGKYSSPRNCGSRINTDRDEATPFYDKATGTLYFSSAGHPNMGGYDVFKTTGKLAKWTDPENMGYPYNSPADDMYFRFNNNQQDGYLVSNRPGVFALKSETCCDDIFSFKTFKTIRIAVEGFVMDEETKTPLDAAKAYLYLTNYKGLDEDILVNEYVQGSGKPYFFELNAETSYKLTGTKAGYLSASVAFDTKGITKSDTLHHDIFLKKIEKGKTYSLRNIYYDYDKATLRDESKPTLDSLYSILTENPGISIELGAHTDARGSDSYNTSLSQKRAESVVKYLIAKGIATDRLKAKGYGETQPLEDCKDVEGCSMESNSDDCPCHQKNRRTEFKIIGEKKIEINYEDERYDE